MHYKIGVNQLRTDVEHMNYPMYGAFSSMMCYDVTCAGGVQLLLDALKVLVFVMDKLSPYARKLNVEAEKRYLAKLSLICCVDPFWLISHSANLSSATPQCFPPVEASDIISYLVLQNSFLTTKQFKAHKSLEAYNHIICGWVKDECAWSLDGKIVVTGRMSELF